MDWKTLRKKIDDKLKENNAHLSQIDLDELIDFAYHFVTDKDSGMIKVKTHQIRRFFDAIKKIKLSVDKEEKFENKEKAKLLMLRPQIFNAAKKQGWILKDLAEITGNWIKKVNNADDFYQFVNFFESLVAFHQAEARD